MANFEELNPSYILEKSDVVPSWINKLDELKNTIRIDLHSGKISGNTVKFLTPLDVPGSPKQ